MMYCQSMLKFLVSLILCWDWLLRVNELNWMFSNVLLHLNPHSICCIEPAVAVLLVAKRIDDVKYSLLLVRDSSLIKDTSQSLSTSPNYKKISIEQYPSLEISSLDCLVCSSSIFWVYTCNIQLGNLFLVHLIRQLSGCPPALSYLIILLRKELPSSLHLTTTSQLLVGVALLRYFRLLCVSLVACASENSLFVCCDSHRNLNFRLELAY